MGEIVDLDEGGVGHGGHLIADVLGDVRRQEGQEFFDETLVHRLLVRVELVR